MKPVGINIIEQSLKSPTVSGEELEEAFNKSGMNIVQILNSLGFRSRLKFNLLNALMCHGVAPDKVTEVVDEMLLPLNEVLDERLKNIKVSSKEELAQALDKIIAFYLE